MLFIEYPKCSTCQKAKKWLIEKGIEFEDRHIIEENPTREELETWYHASGLPLKRFFNTSGSEEQQLDLLATDGMLVKRPVLVGESFVVTGFKEKEWMEKLGL